MLNKIVVILNCLVQWLESFEPKSLAPEKEVSKNLNCCPYCGVPEFKWNETNSTLDLLGNPMLPESMLDEIEQSDFWWG